MQKLQPGDRHCKLQEPIHEVPYDSLPNFLFWDHSDKIFCLAKLVFDSR